MELAKSYCKEICENMAKPPPPPKKKNTHKERKKTSHVSTSRKRLPISRKRHPTWRKTFN